MFWPIIAMYALGWLVAAPNPPPPSESAEASEDVAVVSSLEQAREKISTQPNEALAEYAVVVSRAPSLLEEQDIVALIELLAEPSELTGEAELALLAIGDRVLPSLRDLWNDRERGRYHRRRAGETLLALGEPIDLVPIWSETLGSPSCDARRMAIRRLTALGDSRALAPLTRIARARSCGAKEAKVAIIQIEVLRRARSTAG